MRWAGYFSAAKKEQDATTVQVHAGDALSDMHFSVGGVRVHTVLFRIVTSDGSSLPFDKLGVSVDAADRDALAYHLAQNRNVNGIYPAGYVPPGRYLVQTYIRTPLKKEKLSATLAKWRMTQERIEYFLGLRDCFKTLLPTNLACQFASRRAHTVNIAFSSQS